jgi:enoyl reductase-like protein
MAVEHSTIEKSKLGTLTVFLWGVVTAISSLVCIALMIWGGSYMGHNHDLENAPTRLMKIYYTLKDNNSLIAAILGASALAWAYSFQEWMKDINGPPVPIGVAIGSVISVIVISGGIVGGLVWL